MKDIKFLEDEQSKEIIDIFIKYQDIYYNEEELLPSCIEEKIGIWLLTIDFYKRKYALLEDYAVILNDIISQEKKSDDVLKEATSCIASKKSFCPSKRDFIRMLKSALSSVASPLDFLRQFGFVDPQKAKEILLMDENDCIDLLFKIEWNFSPSNEKQEYLLLMMFFKYFSDINEYTMGEEKFNAICYCRSLKSTVLRYKQWYDTWKRYNIFSINETIIKYCENKSCILFKDFEQLYNEDPYVIVEHIFLEYYCIYENYTISFLYFPKNLYSSKWKQIFMLASDNCIYSNEIYEEYIRFCIQEHIEPVLQFGTLSYTSEEMFNKSPIERDYPHFELGISYQEIKKLYEELKQRKWIDRFTSFNLFVFYFSGKCMPNNLSFIVWTGPINELAYLLTVLYRNKLSTTAHFKIAKQIFIVEGKQNIEKFNLSAIANGLGQKRKLVIDELYDTIFHIKNDI